MVDSADTCGLRPNPQRKSCGFKKKKIGYVWTRHKFLPIFFFFFKDYLLLYWNLFLMAIFLDI